MQRDDKTSAMTDTAIAQNSAAITEANAASPPLGKQRTLFSALCASALLNLVCVCLLLNAGRLIDYRSFYCAGRLALSSPELIYDSATQTREQLRAFPGQGGGIPFYHPPIELLLFAPLARLPYKVSLDVWTVLGIGCVLLSAKLLSPVTRLRWRDLTLLSLALFPTGFALFEGQDSTLLLLALSTVLFFANRKQDKLAGVALALALFKPQVPLVIALAFLLHGRRKLFGSFCASAGVIGIGSFAFLGRTGVARMQSLVHSQEPLDQTWRMPSLRGLLGLVHASRPETLIVSALLLCVFAFRWYRFERQLPGLFSSAILVGTLTAFHFHYYDFSVLLIPAAYLVSMEASRIKTAATFAVASSPIFMLLFMCKCTALLAIPILLLACFIKPLAGFDGTPWREVAAPGSQAETPRIC